MQEEFINIAAHELRTPIQPILGLSEVLLSKKGDIEQYKELLDAIKWLEEHYHHHYVVVTMVIPVTTKTIMSSS